MKPVFARKRIIVATASVLLVAVLAFLAIYGVEAGLYALQSKEPMANLPARDDAQIKRGEYLAKVGDCVACHTAPKGKAFAGGLPLDTGFGTVVSSNITPDRETGIGNWSMKQFMLAMRNGVGDHGKRLYPAMPYNTYAKLTDADLISIKYFLDTLAPVSNAVDSNRMKFPFNIRLLMIGWNFLFLDSEKFVEDSSKSVEWNRGAYLVLGLGHCSTCHSPKNAFGGDKADYFLQGSVLQGWYAPKITGDAWAGIQNWSTTDIAEYLKTGANQHAIAAGPMAEAIANSTQYISDSDLAAVAIYLKSLSGRPLDLPASVDGGSPVMLNGAQLYSSVCATCHGSNGQGVQDMGPPLRGNIAVNAVPPNNALRMIMAGGYSARTGTHPKGFAMPNFDWKLSDTEVADLATFVRNSWGNSAPAVSAAEASGVRASITR